MKTYSCHRDILYTYWLRRDKLDLNTFGNVF